MNAKVLFVDDDANLLASLKRNLRQQFDLETAAGGEEGLAKLKVNGPFAVVVSDRQMPGMDGIQFLSAARQQTPDTVRIMLTGNVDLEHAVRVVNEGNIFRFLIKPCPSDVLSHTVNDAVIQYRLVTAEKELLEKTLNGSVKLLTDILSLVDTKSFGRAQKLRALITELAAKIPSLDTWEIQVAAMLSSIGSVTLPPETLVRARTGQPLSEPEQQLVSALPETTARLLSNIPRLEGVAKIARYQQKHFDGGGFPAGSVRDGDIPLGACLLKILNDMLELQARGKSRTQALDELFMRSGSYDPELLNSVRTALGISSEKTAEQTVAINVNDLTAGMVLQTDILTKDGMLILSGGHQITQMVLEKIRNFQLIYGVQEPIYVKIAH
jgi:response regulator RpfG family c-di-GMP phosphodiesterase